MNPKNFSGKRFSFFSGVIHLAGEESLNWSSMTKSEIANNLKELKFLIPFI